MGYTTEFKGEFQFDKPLTKAQKRYLVTFSTKRRMKRDVAVLEEFMKGKFSPPGIEGYGIEGEYYIGGLGFMGQDDDGSVLDHNEPPSTQPGLWCNWTTDGKTLYWDGGEKFYNYVQWLQYLIDNFFIPWNRVLNGSVQYRGEDWEDIGTILVVDNQISVIPKN